MVKYYLSALFSLLVAMPALATDYIQTTVRIETADETIYSGDVYISDAGCTVRDTNNAKHVLEGAMAACALKSAASIGGFSYELQDSSYGLYLTSIADQTATDTDYWSFFVNNDSASVGLAEYELTDGDTVILSLGGYPNTALTLRAPRQEVVTGEKIRVRVTTDGEPVVGASVYFNDEVMITNSLGKASFTTTQAGDVVVYAEADGTTRTATSTVRVVTQHTSNRPVTGAEQQAMREAAATYLAGEVDEDGLLNASQSVTDWTVIALASAGLDTSNFSAAVLAYDPSADDDYATGELSRHILAITALGHNPADDNGVDYVARLLETVADDQFGEAAYVNDDIFAGLALLAAGTAVDDTNVQLAVEAAIASVNADGGVSYSVAEDVSDVDTTAYFVQLLVATNRNGSVLKHALHYLVEQQNLDGGWGYSEHGLSNASSTAVALQALHAANRTPNKVRSNHRTGYNFLRSVQKPNGRFVYDAVGSYSYETLNSAYAIQALAHSYLPVVY